MKRHISREFCYLLKGNHKRKPHVRFLDNNTVSENLSL